MVRVVRVGCLVKGDTKRLIGGKPKLRLGSHCSMYSLGTPDTRKIVWSKRKGKQLLPPTRDMERDFVLVCSLPVTN